MPKIWYPEEWETIEVDLYFPPNPGEDIGCDMFVPPDDEGYILSCDLCAGREGFYWCKHCNRYRKPKN